jgi:hypothetical protein
MLIEREWQDEPAIFEAVAGALDLGVTVIDDENDSEEEAKVLVYDEEGPYGERGQILLSVNGRRFSLRLTEIV